MARYIDADKLIAHLEDEIKECEIPFGSRANGKGVAYGTILGLKSAISFATALSTENVVPKRDTYYVEDGKPPVLIETSENRRSEVAREIDDLRRYIILNEDIALKCKQENGEKKEEYWKGKLSAFKQIRAYIDAELKKKYTEGL